MALKRVKEVQVIWCILPDYIEDKIRGKYDDHDDDYNNNCVNINDTSLIMSQDVIEGFWDENNETKKLIYIITLSKFNKIKNEIIPLNKRENETKIIYTVLVIYFLKKRISR